MKHLKRRKMVPGVLVAAIMVPMMLAAKPAASQKKQVKDSPVATQTPSAKAKKRDHVRTRLLDATRVSTSAAAKEAARDEALKTSNPEKSAQTGESGIMEFHSTNSAGDNSVEREVVPLKASRRSVLNDVHGEVYGSTGSYKVGTRDAGGAIGFGSKSGKAHIFLGSERSSTPLSSSPQAK